MLIEQAFFALPEVLHGSGYQQQDYEAGIVAAFSMALLQVLNGRNVPNPIGCLQTEKMFRPGGTYVGGLQPRYLRADLFCDVRKMNVANRRLAQYGWRHTAWLEGKFQRRPGAAFPSHSTNKTAAVAGALADLIRLAVLTPEPANAPSIAGRYFLHVYDQPPEYYLTFRKRPWCKTICTEGTHSLALNGLAAEPASLRRLLGNLGNLNLQLEVTNYAALPIVQDHHPIYWCYLTRIDSVTASLDQHSFGIGKDRVIQVNAEGDVNVIAAHVAAQLHLAPESHEAQPPADAEDPGGQQEEEGAEPQGA